MRPRIGIDVDGTNTDAVLLQGQEVVDWIKTPSSADVTSGIITALQQLLAGTATGRDDISGVMVGTTQDMDANRTCALCSASIEYLAVTPAYDTRRRICSCPS